jgi:TadE-like protein
MSTRLSSLQRGATLMEFVILFPVAVLFVLGLIQAGFLYMAKLNLNHATFQAARIGSLHHASESAMREALLRGLIPFHQNSFESNDNKRLLAAYTKASVENVNPLSRAKVERLSPSAHSFKDFGVKDAKTGVTYIPNDNLEWRSSAPGANSKQNLRDANLLKLRVVYGYELKVPLMAGVIRRVMCGGQAGPEAWANVAVWQAVYTPANEACWRYYLQGRMPIESTAIVDMQSRAHQ